MSLVSSFVVMNDGKFYQNPIIYDETGDWFLCFDDDDPPEFVIRNAVISSSRKNREKEILEILEKVGISAKITESRVCGQRNFGCTSTDPKKHMFFESAISAFLIIEKRIPIDKIKIKADSVKSKLKVIDCVVWDPEYPKI